FEKDPEATFYIEGTISPASLLGGAVGGAVGGTWNITMTRPNLPRVVFAPHYYADIYPFLGFNVAPRNFTVEQVRYRDYAPALDGARALARNSLGNVPTVFGEFGAYFNF